MTEVSLQRDGDLIVLMIDGHAEYAENGADIVCAACSALSGTFATMISNLPIAASVKFDSARTKVVINCKGSGTYALQVKYAIDFVMLGYRLLAERYPDNVIIVEG